MQFKDLISETYFKTIKSADEGPIEIFKNPSKAEISDVLKQSKEGSRDFGYGSIRLGITDSKNPTIYAWRGQETHMDMLDHIKFNFSCYYEPSNLDVLQSDGAMNSKTWRTWEYIKNKKEILKAVKKLFPKIKKIDFTGDRQEGNRFNEPLTKYLNESYYKTIKNFGGALEIFKNPTQNDLREIFKSKTHSSMYGTNTHLSVRFGITDSKNPVVYAWHGDVVHSEVYDQIKFDFGSYWEPVNSKLMLNVDYPEVGKVFEKLKYKKEIIKKMKNILPAIEIVNLYGEYKKIKDLI